MQSEFEARMAALIVTAVNLEDVDPADIEPTAALFGFGDDSLGLDSIDALEISMAIAKEFNVQLKADDDNNQKIFSSLRSLAEHVQSQMA